MDAKQFLADLRNELRKGLDIDGLKAIRGKLDDAGLIPEILDYVTKLNDRADLKNELTALRRLADDLNAKRNTEKVILLSATGTGIAVMLGSVAAVATLATGFFLVPLFVGGVVAAHGYIAAMDASEEERVYQQIHEQLKEIDKAIAEKFK